jgi:hypothetical protein
MSLQLDLSESFVGLVNRLDRDKPELRLAAALVKANVALTTYAQTLSLPLEKVSFLQISSDGKNLNLQLINHINSRPWSKKYKGQNITRIRQLLKHLSGPIDSAADGSKELIIVEQLPEHLRDIWFLLPRSTHKSFGPQTKARFEEYTKLRLEAPLSTNGVAIALALLKASKERDVTDIRILLEENIGYLYKALKLDNTNTRWGGLLTDLSKYRQKVRSYLKYPVEDRLRLSFLTEELPEPLRTQVLTYQERARHGFKSNKRIKSWALTKHGLDLKLQAEITIEKYLYLICRGLGSIPREAYGENLGIKDLLILKVREIEIDNVVMPELYNPLVDYYRDHELERESDRKAADSDSRAFAQFIKAIAAVAAYNGLFKLREAFLKEYRTNPDNDTKKNRKAYKKRTFGRPWMNRQIASLKPMFLSIAKEGSFMPDSEGHLSRDARNNLNICLFYITLLTLRFLGVRQQCIRNCVVSKNVLFGRGKSVTFLWMNEEVKNRKGVKHNLDIRKHRKTHAVLIEAIWVYKNRIYPYINGEASEPGPHDRRVQQFFLKIRQADGLCVPFRDHSDFNTWFLRQSRKFLDYEGKLNESTIEIHPHFLRGMFGDWMRYDLRFSKETTGAVAGDAWKTFENEYIEQQEYYDATEDWTRKNEELA